VVCSTAQVEVLSFHVHVDFGSSMKHQAWSHGCPDTRPAFLSTTLLSQTLVLTNDSADFVYRCFQELIQRAIDEFLDAPRLDRYLCGSLLCVYSCIDATKATQLQSINAKRKLFWFDIMHLDYKFLNYAYADDCGRLVEFCDDSQQLMN
jgi:hypothetical protein